jgi:hypothetical protein
LFSVLGFVGFLSVNLGVKESGFFGAELLLSGFFGAEFLLFGLLGFLSASLPAELVFSNLPPSVLTNFLLVSKVLDGFSLFFLTWTNFYNYSCQIK